MLTDENTTRDELETGGASLPQFGVSCGELRGVSCREGVQRAIEIGIRHIDTSQEANNEIEIGLGIRDSGIDPEEMFVSTKVKPSDYRPYDLLWSVRESLDRLRVKRVSLLMLHWPGREKDLEVTLAALNEAADRGLAKHVGVANFSADLFAKANELSERPLVCNEIEYHPFIDQDDAVAAALKNDASIMAHAPLAKGAVNMSPELMEIANRTGATAEQVSLAWLMQKSNVCVLPGMRPAEDLAMLMRSSDVQLSGDDLAQISALKQENLRMCNPGSGSVSDAA